MSNIRYGIFLRPDPATCLAVTQITLAVRQQFGLVAAEAFAPHATLIGNLRTDGTDAELINILDDVFNTVVPFAVFNHGIEIEADSVRYNIMRDSARTHPNRNLASVAASVRDAVAPIHVRHDDFLAPNVQDYRFAAHLSLASFELAIEPRLTHEVGEFIAGLPIVAPASFVAGYYSLFRFRADWSGHWWNDMPWAHVKSWNVGNNESTRHTTNTED
jgi:hypothetical protein